MDTKPVSSASSTKFFLTDVVEEGSAPFLCERRLFHSCRTYKACIHLPTLFASHGIQELYGQVESHALAFCLLVLLVLNFSPCLATIRSISF